jgi:hypothetical protein
MYRQASAIHEARRLRPLRPGVLRRGGAVALTVKLIVVMLLKLKRA